MNLLSVTTGLDQLVSERFRRIRGRRVGVIANPTSVDRRLVHIGDHLTTIPEVELVALFGPEHGIRADAQDMIGVESSSDARTKVPVYTLYGSSVESLRPTSEQLDGIDLLVFDVQDVGSRYYTFAATMLYAMEEAAARGIAFLVLDRPNPIGGMRIEGPTIRPGFSSFVGPHPTPIRHGMTVGELAMLFKSERGLDLDLEVVTCEGWDRRMTWAETGLPWVLPSPNMPTPETALVYPGGCLIEGTNLSEGRGTTKPFELWGAPWIDPYALLDILPDLPGVTFRPCAFRPMFHKFAGQLCQGLQPHIHDREAFEPVWTYTLLIEAVRRLLPDRFAWRTETYEFVDNPIAIDLLYGSDQPRQAIESTGIRGLEELKSGQWDADDAVFRTRRLSALLYH